MVTVSGWALHAMTSDRADKATMIISMTPAFLDNTFVPPCYHDGFLSNKLVDLPAVNLTSA
jgi:hypothetical protein